LAKKHAGKWVALKGDRKTVIASGMSAKSVHAKAVKSGYKQAIITHFPRKNRVVVAILQK
jgi:hypothetical protein